MVERTGQPKRRRVELVEVLIGAVCAGGSRLARARSDFERMDPADAVHRLMMKAIDPELLAAVVGPRLVPVLVDPLRAKYACWKRDYPADWVDVEKVWREQRPRWRPRAAAAASGSASVAPVLSRGYPQRGLDRVGAAAPRAGRRPALAVSAAGRARKAPPVHRPVPAGVASVDDPEVEPVAAPPDEVLSGAAGAAAAGVSSEPDRRHAEVSTTASASGSSRDAGSPAPAGSDLSGVVNGVPAVPPAAPRPAAAAHASRARSVLSDDLRIVLSGGAGALVERLLQAMTDSRASVDSVRRVWIDADGVAGGWDLWALDPAVIDRVRALQRGVER
ncbi:MAG: hypothetical protein OXG72_11625 [Acidobacteria bacterium]|nr:hypothetical protein [Acidobacteriota bacterium]